MSDPKLGRLIDGEAYRDAIHVAVAPVVATEQLYSGQHIGFVRDGDTDSVGASGTPIGIVDPYLKGVVLPGQRFWMFLYQGTITSLRHDWTHSAFENETTAHHKWVTEYAEDIGLSYKELMEGADEFVSRGDYLCKGGTLEGVTTSPEFWDHYEALTRKKVAKGKRASFFSCSC